MTRASRLRLSAPAKSAHRMVNALPQRQAPPVHCRLVAHEHMPEDMTIARYAVQLLYGPARLC